MLNKVKVVLLLHHGKVSNRLTNSKSFPEVWIT